MQRENTNAYIYDASYELQYPGLLSQFTPLQPLMRVYKAGNLVAEVSEKNNRKVQNGSEPYRYEFELKNLERNTSYVVKPTIKDGDQYYEADGLRFGDDGLTEDIHNIIPDEYIEKLKELGLEIHGGNNPPDIEGTYLATPLELVTNNTSMNIAEMWDIN